jgi:DNA-nicking Smr family endonuclease
MSKRSRGLSDDERVLWRAVTSTIAPLKGRKPAVAEAAEPAPVAAVAKQKPSKMMPPAPSLQRVTPPPLATLDRRTKQRIARGRTEIDGRLDLHGLTQAEAHAVLARFLHQAQAREAKVVLVITGKGGPAGEGRGVLKRQVPFWLESSELRSLVIGFENAGAGHGGEGALYVRVRRGR